MINAAFKIMWKNPIEMTTTTSLQELEFNLPLGAIIVDPSSGSDLTNYYTKVQTDTQISNAVSSKANITYVDAQNALQNTTIALKADTITVNTLLANKADLVAGKVPLSQLPASSSLALGETSTDAYRGDRGKIAYDHSQTTGNPHGTLTGQITESSNLWFTDARVRVTPLTGLNTTTGGVITPTDSVLSALGKLQNQVTNSGGGSSNPAWVDITTVGTVQAYVTPQTIQVARFQGMLWVKGQFNVNTSVATNSELFRITNQTYKPYAYSTAGTARLLQVISAWNLSAIPARQIGFSALGNITNSTQASTVDAIFEAKTALSTADGTINIPPTIIGMLAY
jgi:hypothetical protein